MTPLRYPCPTRASFIEARKIAQLIGFTTFVEDFVPNINNWTRERKIGIVIKIKDKLIDWSDYSGNNYYDFDEPLISIEQLRKDLVGAILSE